jgi:hypothetical protein
MARSGLTPEDLQQVRDLAFGWGRIVARRAFGEGGPGAGLDFTALEELAGAAAQGLTEGTLTHLLGQLARGIGQQQPCPDCGAACPVKPQPRRLVVRGGSLTFDEPAFRCPACRRDFFPLAARVGP